MIFEQEVSIFNPNALHSQFQRFNTQIQQTSRNIALIATKEELLQSSASGKSFLETSKGYVDVRADSITSMVEARKIASVNLLYNTGNPHDANYEINGELIKVDPTEWYQYLVAGQQSATGLYASNQWEEKVWYRSNDTSNKAYIYSSRAFLGSAQSDHCFSCDFGLKGSVKNNIKSIDFNFMYDTNSDNRTGTEYVGSMQLASIPREMIGTLLSASYPIKSETYTAVDGENEIEVSLSGAIDRDIILHGETTTENSKRKVKWYVEKYPIKDTNETWFKFVAIFNLGEQTSNNYARTGYIRIDHCGKYNSSSTTDLLVTHLQLEQGNVPTEYGATADETMERTYSMIQQTKDSISAIVGSDGNVTPASLILAMNNNTSSAKLSADQIHLTGTDEITMALWDKMDDSDFTGLKIIQAVNGESSAKIKADRIELTATDSITLALKDKYNTSDFTGVKIAKAINDSGSSVKIKADHIEMTGTTTFLTAKDVGANGSTVIDGGRITSGSISSTYIRGGILQSSDSNTNFSANLNTGKLTMKNADIHAGTSSYWFDLKASSTEGNVSWKSKNSSLSSSGVLTCTGATISGVLKTTSGDNETILTGGQLYYKYKGTNYGSLGMSKIGSYNYVSYDVKSGANGIGWFDYDTTPIMYWRRNNNYTVFRNTPHVEYYDTVNGRPTLLGSTVLTTHNFGLMGGISSAVTNGVQQPAVTVFGSNGYKVHFYFEEGICTGIQVDQI